MTRRVQFPRSSVTGNIPDRLQPGTPAFNWADGKVYVGDPGNQSQLISQLITDHNTSLVYRAGDFAMHDGDLWRAQVDIPADVGFRESEWQRLTTSGGSDAGLRGESGIIDGGEVSWSGTGTTLTVSAGSGLLIDRTESSTISVSTISWGSFQITATPIFRSVFTLWIDQSGTFFENNLKNLTLQRTAVRLAIGMWSATNGTIDYLFENSQTYSGQTVDAARIALSRPEMRVGGVVSASSDLQLSITSGSLIGVGVNKTNSTRSILAADPISMRPVYTDNAREAEVVSVPVTQYDNGGVLTTVPPGNAAIHFLKVGMDGTFFIEYGQQIYGGVTEAINDLFRYFTMSDSNEGSITSLRQGYTAVLAAIIVTPEAVNLTDPATSRIINAQTGSRPFIEKDEQDSSNFYVLDGSRPLSGDMNAGGNSINNVRLDGANGALHLLKNSGSTGFGPAGLEDTEIGSNKIDQKLFMGDTIIADRMGRHDPLRAYVDGDRVIDGSAIYLAEQDIPPGAFDPADWTELGATGGSSEAVILKPQTTDRNLIDLTGNPGINALSIDRDPSQTVDIADFAGATIDRYGMARGNFGGQMIRVAQATHGFTAVGQCVAFDSPNWVKADPNDLSTAGKVIGVVARVVDGNNVDIQLGGTVVNLSTDAFEGGVIVVGETYYASQTTRGRLSTEHPNVGLRVDPVLITVSPTEGVLAIGSGFEEAATVSGKTSFVVNQIGHGFTRVGTPIQKTGADWFPAQGDAESTAGVALVESITSSDTFTASSGGQITALDAAAFAGAVAPTSGTFYYVSQTEAGLLTEIAPTDGEVWNSILLATGATTGIVLAGAPHPSYLRSDGGTVSGSLSVLNLRTSNTSTTPDIAMNDDAALTSTTSISFGTTSSGGSPFLFYDELTTTTSDMTSGSVIAEIRADYELVEDYTLVKKAAADATYLALDGGEMTGALSATTIEAEALIAKAPDTITSPEIVYRNSDGVKMSSIYQSVDKHRVILNARSQSGGDPVNFYFDSTAATQSVNSVLRREDSDKRYLSSSGGDATGSIGVQSADPRFFVKDETGKVLGLMRGSEDYGLHFVALGSNDSINWDEALRFDTASDTWFIGANGITQDNTIALGGSLIGVGQSWRNVESSRSADTSYQNTTGAPITVNVQAGNATTGRDLQVSVDGASWVTASPSGSAAKWVQSAIVPDGHYYRYTGSFQFWAELR